MREMRIAEFGMRNNKNDPKAKARKDRYASGRKLKLWKIVAGYLLFVTSYGSTTEQGK